jgi:hypothetical protein
LYGHKFDLRIYVVITSYDPLRVYVFREGLVRFASEKYDIDKFSDEKKFSHLTNYSINKKNENYIQNEVIILNNMNNIDRMLRMTIAGSSGVSVL